MNGEGSGRGLTTVLVRHMRGCTEENHRVSGRRDTVLAFRDIESFPPPAWLVSHLFKRKSASM